MSDPDRHLRAVHAERADAFARLPNNPPESTPSFVGKVVDGGSMPTTGGKFFLLEPVDADGTESEGGTATLSADSTRKIPTLVLGDDPPEVGDYLVAKAIGGLWVADRGCGSSAVCLLCPSWIPRNLTISWTNLAVGNGSALLTYLGGCRWESGCDASSSAQVKIFLDGSGGTPKLTIDAYSGAACTSLIVECRSDLGSPTRLLAVSARCSPIAFVWDAATVGPNNTYCSYLKTQGYLRFTVTE